MSSWTEKTGFSSTQLYSLIMICVLAISGAFLPADVWHSLLGTSEKITLEIIQDEALKVVEAFVDLGLGGSPYLTEKPHDYIVSWVKVSGTTYYYSLNGSTGQIAYAGTSAYTVLQSTVNKTAERSDGTVMYNTTLRTRPQGSIFVTAGTYPLSTNTLKLVNKLAFIGAGPTVTKITNDLVDGGVIANMWSNFTYDVMIHDMAIEGLNAGGDEGIYWRASDATLPTIDGTNDDVMSEMLDLQNLYIIDCYNPIDVETTTGTNANLRLDHVRAPGRVFITRIIDSFMSNVYCSQANFSRITDCTIDNWYLATGRMFLIGVLPAYPAKGNNFIGVRSDNPSNTPALTITGYAYSNTFSGCTFTNLRSTSDANTHACVDIGGDSNHTTITGSIFGNSISRSPTPATWKYFILERSGTNNNAFVGNTYYLDGGYGTAAHYSEDGPQTSNVEDRKQTYRAGSDTLENDGGGDYVGIIGIDADSGTAADHIVPVEMAGQWGNWKVLLSAAPGAGTAYQFNLSLGAIGSVAAVNYMVNITGTDVWGENNAFYSHDPGAVPDGVCIYLEGLGTPTAGRAYSEIDFYPDLDDWLMNDNT